MIKLCIFDLDGTLLDTVKTIAYYGNYALEKNGLPTAPIKEYNYFAGCGIKNLIINMLKYSNSYTESNYEKVFKDYSTDCICDKSLPFCVCNHRASGFLVNRKPIEATKSELQLNSRSSSAKLRVFEKK